MVKHIILWKLNDELNEVEKESVKKNAKTAKSYRSNFELFSVGI